MAAGVRQSDPGGAAHEAAGEARLEAAGGGKCGAVAAGNGDRLCHGQRAVGVSGKPAGIPLRGGVPQGDGVEPEGAFEREVQRTIADYETRAGSCTTVAVSGGDAAVARGKRSEVVRGEESERRRSGR